MVRNENYFTEGLVSVVTPVYNGEKYLGRLLNSLLAQTWESVEIIIVDDGSSDKTIELAESFGERFAQKGYSYRIISAPHRNASAAVGRGLREVTGEYLIWPDGDDELAPESIEKRVVFLKNNMQYNCVRSVSEYVNFETGKTVNREEKLGDTTPHKLFWDILFGRTFVCCGCYMLRSEVFFEIYGAEELPVYNVGQNFQMLLPFMYHNECPTIDEVLYKVNRRDDSHSARKLSEEEERQKYTEYEFMLDDLVRIIGIKDKRELREIDLWKQKRRMYIAKKYSDRSLRAKTAVKLYKDGDGSFLRMCWRIIRK